jgi:2-C-methyl-D-erythritol 4-phosphate cytidylyltransferase
LAVALIVAAGSGERLGAGRPKALVPLAGRPLLQWSVDVLSAIDAIERIVIALPAGVSLAAPASGSDGPDPRAGVPHGATAGGKDVIGIEGGAVRSESVKRALAAAGPGDPVLVHDAARPLVTSELVRATLDAVSAEGVDAAIAAARVTDTIKHADDDGVVERTLDRTGLWAVQTPQVFRRAALERALDVPDEILAAATDDAWLVERRGGRVLVVDAPAENLKVTTPLDLELAELLIARRSARGRHG